MDTNLREVCLGDWQGRLVSDLEVSGKDSARFADRLKYPAAVAPPGGETAVQVLERLLRSVERIAQAHPKDTVVVVTHGFAVALLLSHFRDIPLDQVWDYIPANGEINQIDI
jgi:broad specificity phosphatase PhoE